MTKYYTIGQIAAIFKMDVQILRHYDTKGLLIPAVRNTNNNYRMYDFNQVVRLAAIRYLRKLGYPLKKISEFMDARDAAETIKTLREQSEILHKQCEELLRSDAIIRRKLAFIEAETTDWQPEQYHIKKYEKRRFIPLGEENTLYAQDLFYFNPTICFYEGDKKWFGAYLCNDGDDSQSANEVDGLHTSYIEAGRYLCGYHRGPYHNVPESIRRLRAHSAGIKLEDQTINFNIIDQFIESRPENYITQLQIRVLD